MTITEHYTQCPAECAVYPHSGGTDVILRKNIHLVERPVEGHGGEESSPPTWECEELQYRYPGMLTLEEIQADPDKWWAYMPPKPEQPKTDTQRIEDLEKKNRQLQEQIDALVEGRTS